MPKFRDGNGFGRKGPIERGRGLLTNGNEALTRLNLNEDSRMLFMKGMN
jgi:hypothetical protein